MFKTMRIRALTVTEVNTYLKRILNQDPIMSHIKVHGEISNFKLHSSGHAYFAIKDKQSKLNCVMFKQSTPFGLQTGRWHVCCSRWSYLNI